jgi:hypothetical protein
MAFYRVYPSKDSWITNRAAADDTSLAATGSNHGESPSLNVFAFAADVSPNAIDVARSLIKFDLTELSGKIYSEGLIPSASVVYYLKMFDMKHSDTVPTSYDLLIFPTSRSWDEGTGIDDDNDRDSGAVNWMQPTSTTNWVVTGSDFLATEYGSASMHFDKGSEDLEVRIDDMVIGWLTGAIANNGMLIKFSDTEENTGDYYRKAFHARESKYIDRIPYLEARWDDTVKDNRENFALNQSSSLYLYNVIRGELIDLTAPVIVRLQDSLGTPGYSIELTASRIETGIYRTTAYLTASGLSSSWHDIWFSGSRAYMTGTFTPLVLTGSEIDPYDEFDVDVTNLKRVYGSNEEARLNVSVRKRDWITHVGPIFSASAAFPVENIEKMYYSIINEDSGEVVVPFGTGSLAYTQLSYNGDGNYFNLSMNSFVPGFKYRIKFLIDINRYTKAIIDDNFTFKVV